MDASNPVTPDVQRQQDRKRKRKAILAGGVVLGLGAAVTLAAWSDDVFGNGDFNTGSFNLIGSASAAAAPTETDYAEWDSPSGADLSFRIGSLNMSPGETVAAPFSIAQSTTPDTSVDGRVWMFEATANGTLAPHLAYTIKQVDAPTECVADDPATTEIETVDLDALPTWNEYDFADGITNAANAAGQRDASPSADTQDLLVEQDFGNQQHLCIQVTLEDDEDAISLLDRTNPTSIVWQFRGESETPTS